MTNERKKNERKEIAQYLGNKIKLLRINNNVKQKDLSTKLGFTQAYLSDIERGITLIPTDVLFKISAIFGIGLDYFNLDDEHANQIDDKDPSDDTFEKRLGQLEEDVQKIKELLKT